MPASLTGIFALASALLSKRCDRGVPAKTIRVRSALPGLESALRLVDHIDPTFATHDAVVAVAATQ
jgi:hypothetical protein